MDSPYIAGRRALAEASELMDRFGDDAGLEAAARAERSRDAGNVLLFCHWRQIERVIATLVRRRSARNRPLGRFLGLAPFRSAG